MDSEIVPGFKPSLPSKTLSDALRAKTSLRMTYEAQARVIQDQIGSLEMVREKLGLSSRKMAQLLMVDPSAWTRWTKKRHTVPPHIYRSLQWYLALEDKLPGINPQLFIGASRSVEMKTEIKQEVDAVLNLQLQELTRRILSLKRWLIVGFAVSATSIAVLLILLLQN